VDNRSFACYSKARQYRKLPIHPPEADKCRIGVRGRPGRDELAPRIAGTTGGCHRLDFVPLITRPREARLSAVAQLERQVDRRYLALDDDAVAGRGLVRRQHLIGLVIVGRIEI